MLFCYPIEATHENWLHEGLIFLLSRAFRGDKGPLTKWLDVFPEEKRTEISRKTSLKAALERVVAGIRGLGAADRKAFLTCMEGQNRFPDVFSPVVEMWPVPTGHGTLVLDIHKLFSVAFGLLTPLGVRDRQYKRIYDAIPARVCAFCGIEPLTAPTPELPRESLDHYLAISRYSFAGANLRNLAPTGTRCNSSHKLATDILAKADGSRRRCFDPFGMAVAQVSLLNSRPLEGEMKDLFILPEWRIELIGDTDAIETWDEVYEIKARYRHNVLNAEIRAWLDHFAQWCGAEAEPPECPEALLKLIERYLRAVVQEGFSGSAFLKRATFEMLAHQCRGGEGRDRITAWLISLLSRETGAATVPDDSMPTA
jgi:hypothetical protein